MENQTLFLRAPSTITVGEFVLHIIQTPCTLLHAFIIIDFPPKKGAELDKVFQDLEDLLKI